jgi:hypothetical protein
VQDLTDAYFLLTIAAVAAMTVGGLAFAGGTVAPVAVRVLPEESAARFLRAFWPRYYRGGVLGGLALTLAMAALVPTGPLGTQYTTVLLALAALFTVCLWLPLRLIPVINAARDAGSARFDRLHGFVVALTGVALLAGVAFLGALGWVLPGQYMIWMQ